MGFRFNGLYMPGKVLKGYRSDAPERRVTRENFPGVDGEAEILLGRGARNILIPMVVFDATLRTYASVFALIKQLDGRLAEAQPGKLDVELGYGDGESFPNCAFLGYERLTDILPDVGGGFVTTRLTYFTHLMLVFRQLRFDEKA